MKTRRWVRRLQYWLHGAERARLLREEMEAHLELKALDFVESGMGEAEARAKARREFGNVGLLREESRQTWIARWLSDLLQDSAYAGRTLRRQPAFAAVAVASTALGIGACSLIFGLANVALFRPLPVSEPMRLMSISGKRFPAGRSGQSMTFPDFEDLRKARSFEGITAFFQFVPATISSRGEPQRYWGSLVTANYFNVVRPAFLLGRGFDASRDDRPGEPPVVVLSNRLWKSRFGSDAGILGQRVELNKRKVTVVGVTAAGFQGTEVMFFSDFWIPFSLSSVLAEAGMGGDRLHDRGSQWLAAAGRLREGVSERAAVSEIDVIGAQLRSSYPATNKERSFAVERAGQLNPGTRKMLVVFFVLLVLVAALVLSTACANIANLLLARASARQKEIATRLAIGAGSGRLIRQLLTESVMLALLGGIGGLALAQLGAISIGRLNVPLALPLDLSIVLDQRVLLFSLGLAVLTGVVFGLVPALRATRPSLLGALKDEGLQFGGSKNFGLRQILVVAQVAACMVLLICSGLFLRSFYNAQALDTGFSHRNLLLVAFDPSLNRYTPDESRRLFDTLLERVRALPGVESVSLTSTVPLSLEGTQNGFTPEDQMAQKERKTIIADIYSISSGYFDTFGIRMISGADFRRGTAGEEVAIVNQALADRAFPHQNPIGRRISYFGRMIRIVGLVATAKSRSIGENPRPCLYLSLAKDPRGNDSLTGVSLVVRTRGNPATYTTAVRGLMHDIDPALALFNVRTMEAHLWQALFLARTAAWAFGVAGLMGLLISTVGIYGLISFLVAQRTKEIAVRMALGARRAQVLGMVVRQGLLLTGIGALVGLGLALALARIATSLLYGVTATDPLTFVLVPLFLLAVAMLACIAPARRAASLDPIGSLRYQ